MQIVQVLLTNLHGDFNGIGISLRHHAQMQNIANGDPFERHDSAILQPAGVGKVAAQHDPMGEETA